MLRDLPWKKAQIFFKASQTSNKGLILQLVPHMHAISTIPIHEALQESIAEFEVVFEEPKGLPPQRSHDHQILLKEGT